MSTRIQNTPRNMRKQPRQARSRATMEAILEASARILGDEGWAGFTTNKVAHLAGVSIGSYYQYFPDKHSLVDAIRDRHLGDCLGAVQSALEGERTPGVFADLLVDALIAIHSDHPGMHRVLLDEVPVSEAFRDPTSAFEREYLDLFRTAVSRYRRDEPEDRLTAIGAILSDAIDGVIHNAARRGTLGTKLVRDELVRMIVSFLSDQPRAPHSPGFTAAR